MKRASLKSNNKIEQSGKFSRSCITCKYKSKSLPKAKCKITGMEIDAMILLASKNCSGYEIKNQLI